MKCPRNMFEECLKEECGFWYRDSYTRSDTKEPHDTSTCAIAAIPRKLSAIASRLH